MLGYCTTFYITSRCRNCPSCSDCLKGCHYRSKIISLFIYNYSSPPTLAAAASPLISSAATAITIASTGIVTFVDDIIIKDAGTIGSASDTDAISISSGGVVNISATTANTSASDGALTVAGGAGIAADLSVGDDLRLISDSAVLSFGADSDTTLTHTDGSGLTLNSTNKIMFRDSALSVSSSADGQLDIDADTEVEITTTTVDVNGILLVDGSNISLDSTSTLNIDNSNTSNGITIGTATATVPISIGHSTSEVTVNDNLTVTGDLTVSGTTTTVNSTTVNLNDHNIVLDSGNSTSAVINGAGITIEGGTGSDATFTYSTSEPQFELKLGSSYEDLKVDQLIADSLDIEGNIDVNGTSNLDIVDIDGAVDMASTLTVAGVVDVTDTTDSSDATGDTGALRTEGGASIAKKLYVGTDLDVDGTTNLDAVDIDGAVQVDNTVTVGVDDTGYDVKFFGATSGQFMLWDESADELALTGDSKLSFHDAAGGENIIASSDGHLEINAGTTLDITAATTQVNAGTLFDVNGDADISGTLLVTGVATLTAKPIANAGMSVKNGSTSAGFVEFFENSGNGSNKVTLIGPASSGDVTLTLPSTAGTVATTASAADEATALAIALG